MPRSPEAPHHLPVKGAPFVVLPHHFVFLCLAVLFCRAHLKCMANVSSPTSLCILLQASPSLPPPLLPPCPVRRFCPIPCTGCERRGAAEVLYLGYFFVFMPFYCPPPPPTPHPHGIIFSPFHRIFVTCSAGPIRPSNPTRRTRRATRNSGSQHPGRLGRIDWQAQRII